MSSNKTLPTKEDVGSFLMEIDKSRREDANVLITMMQDISHEPPVMWGPSIIGFGSMHYKYDSGHEGDMPILAFSPRKSNLAVYFEGFDEYGASLEKLGKYKASKACLYFNKLADIDLAVLRDMLQRSYDASVKPRVKPTSVQEYIASIPVQARPKFDELRQVVKDTLPNADEVLSYGIIGYKKDTKQTKVYISGWIDHVAIYPVPKNEELQERLARYIKGKGTIWIKLDEPLPKSLIVDVVKSLLL